MVYAAKATAAERAERAPAAERAEDADAGSSLPFVATRQPAGESAAAAAALAGAASFGTTAVGGHRAVVAFAGAPAATGEQPLSTPWMLRAALDLQHSSLLLETGAEVTFAEEDAALVVNTDVRASSAAAPGVIRAVMLALRPSTIVDTELETATIPESDLAGWRRDAGAVERGGAVVSDGIESRWLWAAAVVLLAIETWVRRRQPSVQREVHADAA